jgi:hypothetical protein
VVGQVGPTASLTDVVHRRRSVRAGQRQAEAGELAGDGDRDDRSALGAVTVQAPPDVVQALLACQEIARTLAGWLSWRRSGAFPRAGRLR